MSGSRIYIGRLSSRAEKRDVEKFFKEYGDIREINLKNGFGFVEFKDYRDAEDAVKESNDREFFGHRIIVEIAKGERRRGRYNDRRGGDYDRRNNNAPQRTDNRIYVENIAQSVSWQDLKDFFRRAGQVTFADAHKRREGEGIVEFSSYDDVKEALHKLDGYELKGQKITLRDGSRRYNSRRYSRSRSRSRTRSRKRSYSRDRRYSPRRSDRSSRRSRSRTRSRSRSFRSRTRSRTRSRSRSRSRSNSIRDQSRSRSPSQNYNDKNNRNDNRSQSRSRSPTRSRSRSRSRSPSVSKSPERPINSPRDGDDRQPSRSPEKAD